MAEGRASRMYRNSPTMKRSEEGHMEVSRKKSEHMEKHGGTSGTEEAIPHHIRHAHERHMMHAKHENEHAMADHHGHPKGEMYKRHEQEIADMNARHENESSSDVLDKVESGKGE